MTAPDKSLAVKIKALVERKAHAHYAAYREMEGYTDKATWLIGKMHQERLAGDVLFALFRDIENLERNNPPRDKETVDG